MVIGNSLLFILSFRNRGSIYSPRVHFSALRETMRRLAIVLISVIVTFWSSAPIVQAQFLEAGIVKFRVPVEAPDFRLKELTGGEISLKELKGKVVILNFFDTA